MWHNLVMKKWIEWWSFVLITFQRSDDIYIQLHHIILAFMLRISINVIGTWRTWHFLLRKPTIWNTNVINQGWNLVTWYYIWGDNKCIFMYLYKKIAWHNYSRSFFSTSWNGFRVWMEFQISYKLHSKPKPPPKKC